MVIASLVRTEAERVQRDECRNETRSARRVAASAAFVRERMKLEKGTKNV